MSSGAAAPELPSWNYWLNTRPDHQTTVTRANAADGYPNPLSPLTQDLVITCENYGAIHFFRDTLGVIDRQAESDPFMFAFYGLICINVDLMGDIGARLPGTTRRRLLEQYFGFNHDPDRPEPDTPPSRLRAAGHGLKIGGRMVRAYRDFGPHIDRVRDKIAASRPAGDPSGPELAAWLERLFECASDAWVLPMVGGSLAASALDAVRGQIGGPAAERTDLCNRLHTGIGGNESAEAGLVARRLADCARAEGLAEALATEAPTDELARLSPRFGSALETAVERFGYRAVSELEVARPSWRQDPEQLLDSVRREMTAAAPVAGGTDAIRDQAEAEARERLGRARYAALRHTLRISRKILSLRENSKIPVVAAHDEVRRVIEIAGPLLAEQGALPDPEAACYLQGSELAAALRGQGSPSAAEIAGRRSAYERCWSVELPELMRADGSGLSRVGEQYFLDFNMIPPQTEDAPTGAALSGIGVAPGKCTATARVIDDPTGPEGDEFAPGDVLVASTVDPGWAPLLAVAGAVVLDIGGELSHGAMVARELGIPCVVNVKQGTRTIEPGSLVEVDGSGGTVTTVEREPEPAVHD